MVRLIQESGFNDFQFLSLVCTWNQTPILYLPLFEARFPLSTFTEGVLKTVLNTCSKFIPFLRPRILGVGIPEGEWGQVGFDEACDKEILNTAWELALQKIQERVAAGRIEVTAFVNFNEKSGKAIPTEKLFSYVQVPSIPCAQLPINFPNEEKYLERLSKNTRKNLRKKLREADQIHMVRTTDPTRWLASIYELYLNTVQQSAFVFGVHRKEYFQDVCKKVAGAAYALYFYQDKLIGFNLLVQHQNKLVDKYFAMDQVKGREMNLYFVSWLENVRYCTENKIECYHAGPSSEATKERLGAEFLPSVILFKHHNPILHRLLVALQPFLVYEPEIPLPEVCLGQWWDKEEKKEMSFYSLALDLDGSLAHQKKLKPDLDQYLDLQFLENDLRLWGSKRGIAELRSRLKEMRASYPGPWLTYLGSGDFHHLTLLLLESFPVDREETHLVLIDNHPDWYTHWPKYHCGNWISSALRLPWLKSVTMIGQNSSDLYGRSFFGVPYRDFVEGRIHIYPYERKKICVPFRWDSSVRGAKESATHWYGTEIRFETVNEYGASAIFQKVAEQLKGKKVYLSLDKDAFCKQDALTDWDQGKLTLQEVLEGIQILKQKCQWAGADICGEKAAGELQGLIKRMDAGRFSPEPFSASINEVNERTNLQLQEMFQLSVLHRT